MLHTNSIYLAFTIKFDTDYHRQCELRRDVSCRTDLEKEIDTPARLHSSITIVGTQPCVDDC